MLVSLCIGGPKSCTTPSIWVCSPFLILHNFPHVLIHPPVLGYCIECSRSSTIFYICGGRKQGFDRDLKFVWCLHLYSVVLYFVVHCLCVIVTSLLCCAFCYLGSCIVHLLSYCLFVIMLAKTLAGKTTLLMYLMVKFFPLDWGLAYCNCWMSERVSLTSHLTQFMAFQRRNCNVSLCVFQTCKIFTFLLIKFF